MRFVSFLVIYKKGPIVFLCLCACVVWVHWDCCVCHVNELHYSETANSLNVRGGECSKDLGFGEILLFSKRKMLCDFLLSYAISLSLSQSVTPL